MSMLLVGTLAFIFIAYFTPDQYISKDEMNKFGIYPSELAENYGFRKGDRILAVDGNDFERFEELLDPNVYQKEESVFTILREGKETFIKVPFTNTESYLSRPFLEIMTPVEIDSVLENSPAEKSGLIAGDRIVSVNGVKLEMLDDLHHELDLNYDGIANLQLLRRVDGDTIIIAREVELNLENRIGVLLVSPDYTNKENTFSEAIAKGTGLTFLNMKRTIQSLFDGFSISGKSRIRSMRTIRGSYSLSWAGYYMGTLMLWFFIWNFLPYPKSALWETIPLAYEGLTKKRYPFIAFKRSLALAWFILLALFVWKFILDIVMLF
jgi:regulator of sigma E protease